jgi:2,4-dienoyl-CoA reductase-like NADH-dependent reductase (Old Yellow Enzyme family)
MSELFEPFTMPNGLTLRNRIVFAPCTTYSSYDSSSQFHQGGSGGHIHPEELTYLERRARGVGLVVTAACYTIFDGKGFTGQWGCDRDEKMPSLEAAASAIHRGGAKSFLQIHDAGRQSPSKLIGKPARAPSSIAMPRDGAETPRAMTEADIETAIQAFADAATRAKNAGFDGVEIHGANTYLLQQFVSPHSNRRDDDWGGSLEHRLRFPLEVTRRVRAAVGPDYPIGYRYSPEESWEPGMSLDDTNALLEGLRKFDLAYISVSTGDYWQPGLRDQRDTTPRAHFTRTHLPNVPVIGVGGVWTRAEAERILADGTQLVALGRALICDPEWAEHAEANLETPKGFPREGWEALSVPQGLARKILETPGWFPVR